MQSSEAATTTRRRLTVVSLGVVLVAAVIAAFSASTSNGWFLVDDPEYVTAEPRVLAGFTRAGIEWAFTGPHGGNWHPLTTLTHMLDVEWFGTNPGGPHAVNVGLHALACVLVFASLTRLTRSTWASFVTALLFAVHPLRVESVAWIAERKDVLAGVFFALTLLLYARWLEKRSPARLFACVFVFALGLMAKPMLVTLPFVLLLLDYWPSGRARSPSEWVACAREKLPFFALSLASCVITYLVQRGAGAMKTAEGIPLGERLANAPLAVVAYVRDTLWPVDLAPYYPFVIERGLGAPIVCALAIGAACLFAWRQRAERPYVVIGLAWFLGMLVPVIGIVQVGGQARADRYTYLPSIGLVLVAAFGAREFVLRHRGARASVVALFGLAAVACIFLSRAQTARWKDSATLAEHTLAATGETNAFAHLILAKALTDKEPTRAREHVQAALRLVPGLPAGHGSLGLLLARENRFLEAEAEFRAEIAIRPTPAVYKNHGLALAWLGRMNEALDAYEKAIELAPRDTAALLEVAWTRATSSDERVRDGRKALSFAERARAVLGENDPAALTTLAAARAETGDFGAARDLAAAALEHAQVLGNPVLVERARLQVEAYGRGRVYRP